MPARREVLKRASFYLEESQTDELEEAADELGMGKSEIVREALEDWFMRHRVDAPTEEQDWRDWRGEYMEQLNDLLDEFEQQAIVRGEALGKQVEERQPRTTRRGPRTARRG